MNDRRDEELQRLARDYHRPPETPREEMWARIEAERARRRDAVKVQRLAPWMRWSLAAAAVLVVGIAIGRLTVPGAATPPPTALALRSGDVAYRMAAAPYLTRTEALLTSFRAQSHAGRVDADFAAEAQDLLVTTRLMLNSPAARDPRLASLLQDLEVMLVQIAQLPADGDTRGDVELINHGLEQRSVMLRLRAASPTPGLSARGAL